MQVLSNLFSRMRGANNDGGEELFLFAHLPKTGGQTLRNCFRRHLEFHREFIHLGPFGENDAAKLGLLPFEQRPVEERARAKVILGHRVTHQTHLLVPGKLPRYVLFLRDPAELLVSLYNFEMRYQRPADQPVVPFEKWYKDGRRANFITNFLLVHFLQSKKRLSAAAALPLINSALEKFWFVGCSEFLDDDAPLLLSRIGVPQDLERSNVAGVHYPKTLTLDDSLRATLHAESEVDLQLYRTWRSRLPQSRDRVRAEIAPKV
jgi:hypothetical protein